MIEQIVFVLLALWVIVPAVLAVTLKNVFHCALFLVLSLTGVAGLFAMLGADFLFVAQLLVYAGGITVLLLFVVLLSGSPKDWIIRQTNAQWSIGLLVAGMFVALLATVFKQLPPVPAVEPLSGATTARLGLALLGEWVFPFEALSLVLLAALVGAIHFSKRSKS